MAKSSSFFGLRTGSTKSHTYQVLRGQQITKDRVTKVSNPQTSSQMAQRLKLPIVTANREILKELVNHSFEGTAYGDASLRKFSELNLTKGNLTIKEYVPKGISNTGVANLEISRGSLLPNTVAYKDTIASGAQLPGAWGDEKKEAAFTMPGSGYYNTATAPPDAATTLDKVNADVFNAVVAALLGDADQLTWLVLYKTDTTFDFSGQSGDQTGPYFRYVISRITNEQSSNAQWTLTSLEDGVSLSDGYVQITIKKSETAILNSYGFIQVAGDTTPDLMSCAVITSAKTEENSWKRSPQRLVVNNNVSTYIDFSEAESTYLKSASASSKYLNTGLTGVGITGGTQADVNKSVAE